MSKHDDKLAALRSQRAALEAKREAREAEREASDELEREQQAIKDLEAIEKLEEEHGPKGKKWDTVDTRRGIIAVKRPAGPTWKKFTELEKIRHQDVDAFVRPCRIYPDAAEFNAIVEDEPAALMRAATKACELAGLRRNEVQGK